MTENKLNRSEGVHRRQEESPSYEARHNLRQVHGTYSDWMNVSGDVDDFIFYDNYKSVSDR